MPRRLTAAAALAIAGLVVVPLAAAPAPAAVTATGAARPDRAQPAAASPPCFGAAARDPLHPCVNTALDRTATPTPDDAALEPSSPCRPIGNAVPPACKFGPPRDTAQSSVALLGDSHGEHWRAALTFVAQQRNWHGISMTRNDCPFTFATTPGKGRCKGWVGRVLRWLRVHPEVHHVVVSANSGSGVTPAGGQSFVTAKVDGYIEAWKALPRTVHDVFVIHDVPHGRYDTNDCVRRALAKRRNPALRCARPRKDALAPDFEAKAAERTDSSRVHLIDLTPFMCDEQRCYPVVGGALVIKDVGHLTRTFSTTLGPFLGRAISEVLDPGPPG